MPDLWHLLLSSIAGAPGMLYYSLTGTSPIPVIQPVYVEGPLPTIGTPAQTPQGTPDTRRADLWLAGLAIGGIALAGAPVLYKALQSPRKGKRAKKASELGEGLEMASNRATTLAAALIPAFGLPLAYITVQALEDKGVISGDLGDKVQTMIGLGAAAPALGAIGSFAKAVV